MTTWKPIKTAPTDRKVWVAAYIIPSAYAQKNGAKPFWDIAESSLAYGTPETGHWYPVLSGKPTLWKELTEEKPEPPETEAEDENPDA